jgi:ribose transport system ATP-binding protein
VNPEQTGQDVGDVAEGAQEASATVLSVRGMRKSFAGIEALRGVDLDIAPGTVHALVGENGAGKSTLCKIIAGIHEPDEGEVIIGGDPVVLPGPAAAQRLGISFVPQELSNVPWLSMAENICMGTLPSRKGIVHREALGARARGVLEQLRLPLDPRAELGSFSPGIQQLVMIARGLSREANLFILDEPTAALTESEVDHLFETIRATKRSGSAFIYVSHRMEELARIADEVTVLRDGEKIFTRPIAETNRNEIIRAMVGRPISRFFPSKEGEQSASGPTPRLSVRGLTRAGQFRDVSFDVHAGTIVGMAGLLGAGRTEVLRSIFGIDHLEAGEIEIDGRPMRPRSPRDAIRHGIALVPEERKTQGLVLGMSVADNLTAPFLGRYSRSGWLRKRRARAAADTIGKQFGIKATSLDVPVASLSGGNQQKVVIGRWVLSGAKVYLLDEPTRGVDVGAKAEIYESVRDLARNGSAVLVVSSELPELIGLCDRILVMAEGRLVAEMETDQFSEEAILSAAIGHEEEVVRA